MSNGAGTTIVQELLLRWAIVVPAQELFYLIKINNIPSKLVKKVLGPHSLAVQSYIIAYGCSRNFLPNTIMFKGHYRVWQPEGSKAGIKLIKT